FRKSGRWDSNPRRQPWECAVATGEITQKRLKKGRFSASRRPSALLGLFKGETNGRAGAGRSRPGSFTVASAWPFRRIPASDQGCCTQVELSPPIAQVEVSPSGWLGATAGRRHGCDFGGFQFLPFFRTGLGLGRVGGCGTAVHFRCWPRCSSSSVP